MNKRLIIKTIGFIVLIEAGLLLLPLVVALIYHESDWIWFLVTSVALAVIGGAVFLFVKPKKQGMHAKDGFVIVALAWIVMSMAAAIPFTISGSIPNYLNACFETVSGFTTSGVTILDDIEALSNSMLFWRSFTHWIGGMGVLVFMLAIMPLAGGTSMHIMRAESPGPVTEKIAPKISQTAKWLYIIYGIMTLVEAACLTMAKMSVFHSFLISFGTVATGGFSYLNTSLMEMTMAQQVIVSVFMYLAGMNFALFFLIATGKVKEALKNEELHWYLGICVLAVALISVNVYVNGGYESFGMALHYAAFMVGSVITTTGFSATDTNLWPWFSKGLIMLIMFIGGCAGSTAGGVKVSRLALMVKSARRYLHELIHPRSVNTIRFNGKSLDRDAMRGILEYFAFMILLFCGSMFIVTLDPHVDSFITAFSAVNTTLNNNGVAFGLAAGSFNGFAWYSKVIFILDMLIGRLEIFPIVILFSLLLTPVTIFQKKVHRGRAR